MPNYQHLLNQKIVKSVLNKHKNRDSWFLDDYSVNPYEGAVAIASIVI